jgi:hypothetical protein
MQEFKLKKRMKVVACCGDNRWLEPWLRERVQNLG